MRIFLAAIAAAITIASASSAATVDTSNGLGLNFNAGNSFDGLEVTFTVDSILANQLSLFMYSEENLGGSLIGQTTLPFGGSGPGGAFVFGPDLDGVGSIVARAEFGSFELNYRNFFDELDCSGTTASTCTNRFAYFAVNPNGAYPAPVPVPASLPLILVGLGGIYALRRKKS